MRLERQYYDIKSVKFGENSHFKSGTLVINKKELSDLAASKFFSRVEIDIAAPGSGVRILNAGDITQPAIRPDEEDTVFPGLLGKMSTVGDGRTLMLRGVAVTEVLEIDVEIQGFMQMSDEAADITDLAAMWHVTIDAHPAQDVSKYDYLSEINLASKRVAKHLASLASGHKPDNIEVFELPDDNPSNLPRVAYLANVFCHRPFTETLIYGVSMFESLPVILHPNEILDGAIVNRDYDNSVNADPTYVWQNHPIILELFRRSGVDLHFAGVVVNNTHHELTWKQRNAAMSAALMKNNLRADAVIITKEGGGHPQVDVGIETDVLEGKYGIKTAIALVEMLSTKNDSYGQILFSSEYADAMVSTGCSANVVLPPAKKVIGSILNQRIGNTTGSKDGELEISHRTLRSGQSQLGWTLYGSQKF